MVSFTKLDIEFDVSELAEFLSDCDLWDKHPQRRIAEGSPHSQMTDIWARYKNPGECIKTGDWSSFIEPHESEWLEDLPQVKEICKMLSIYLDGEALGGVLITKLPAGGAIDPHADSGWHASYYDKYFVPIKNEKGAKFCFDSGEIEPSAGECYAFRNDVTHWVENNSNEERIAMIICIKQTKLSKGGRLCHGEQ